MFLDVTEYLVYDKSKDWQKVSMVLNVERIIMISRSRILPKTKKGRSTYRYYVRINDFTKREVEISQKGYVKIRNALLSFTREQYK